MHKTFLFTCVIFLSNFTFGQTNYEQFKKLWKENDTANIKSLLTEWEKSKPNDPELYTSSINFYFSNAKKEVVSIGATKGNKESFQLTDSAGNVAGFISSNINYDQEKVAKAIKYANTGIEKFPDRLDIRFGKCYILSQIGDYETFTKEIINTIEYSTVNKNNWLWTENKKLDDGEKFLLDAVQAYLKELFDTENDDLLPNMIRIGNAALNHYPNSIEILSTTSVALLLTNHFDKAIHLLKQAERLNPKDFIVLNNIARAYQIKGDKENAIKYYRLTKKYGDKQAKQQAMENIKQLEK